MPRSIKKRLTNKRERWCTRLQLHTLWLFLLACVSLPLLAQQDASNILPLMPTPARVQSGEGRFVIDQFFAVELRGHADSRVRRVTDRFLTNLSSRANIRFGTVADSRANFIITCSSEGEGIQKLGEDESYRLQVMPEE